MLAVIPYDTEDDAVRIANDSVYGLAGSVCTTDNEKAMEIASKIRTGTYAVNMYAFDPGAPFGGYKNSGIGRENGPEGIEAVHARPRACCCRSATRRRCNLLHAEKPLCDAKAETHRHKVAFRRNEGGGP